MFIRVNPHFHTVGETLLVFTTQIYSLQLQPIFNKAGLQFPTRLQEYRLYSNAAMTLSRQQEVREQNLIET